MYLIFLIIKNLPHIQSLGKSNMPTILQNGYKTEILANNSSFPFYYYGSIYSTLITSKAGATSG